MKNRKFNQGLKNVASWAYWSNTDQYAMGTYRENQPFFEALTGIFSNLFFAKYMYRMALIHFFSRRERLGLVYSFAQRDHVSWNCDETRSLNPEEESYGISNWH